MKKGDKVQYIGRDFIGFNPKDREMTIVEVLKHDLIVDYNRNEMMVYKHEVKEIEYGSLEISKSTKYC